MAKASAIPDLNYVHDRSIVGVSAARNRAMSVAATRRLALS